MQVPPVVLTLAWGSTRVTEEVNSVPEKKEIKRDVKKEEHRK
jgi:hypothetical protein